MLPLFTPVFVTAVRVGAQAVTAARLAALESIAALIALDGESTLESVLRKHPIAITKAYPIKKKM